MKRLCIILAACMAALLPGVSLCAQTRQETSLYGKTVRKPTVKAAQKFLKKYPDSVYAPKVTRLRDSLVFFTLDPDDAAAVLAFRKDYPDSPFKDLADVRIRGHNTSGITHDEALGVAGACLDAVGWKKDNVEHVLALDGNLELRILSPDGSQEAARSIPVYTLSDFDNPLTLALPMEVISPFSGRNYLHFAYLNGEEEYVEVLYLPEEDILSQAMFYGTPAKRAGGEAYRIEGQSPEMMEGLSPTAEVLWLTGRLQENQSLVQLSREDLLTDESVKWWLERNPDALGSASRLHFGKLDSGSSIVAAYKKARKEKGRSANAALFDIRGYTVICAANKAGTEYTLVWCEPVCKNKYRDRFLNSIYFDADGTTLNLFYYKGRTTFKYRISLASQTIRR